MTNAEMRKAVAEIEYGITKMFDKYKMTDKEFTYMYSKIAVDMAIQVAAWNFENVEEEREEE